MKGPTGAVSSIECICYCFRELQNIRDGVFFFLSHTEHSVLLSRAAEQVSLFPGVVFSDVQYWHLPHALLLHRKNFSSLASDVQLLAHNSKKPPRATIRKNLDLLSTLLLTQKYVLPFFFFKFKLLQNVHPPSTAFQRIPLFQHLQATTPEQPRPLSPCPGQVSNPRPSRFLSRPAAPRPRPAPPPLRARLDDPACGSRPASSPLLFPSARRFRRGRCDAAAAPGRSGGQGGRWEMAEYLASIFGTEKDK